MSGIRLDSPMEFADLETIKVPVTISTTKYLLIEASEDDARKYRNAATSAGKIVFRENEDREVQPGNIGDLQSYLLSLCLHELDQNGVAIRTAPLVTIRSWPARVVKSLFARAKEISDLTEAPETLEELQKQIDRLTAKRDSLLAGKNGQAAGKDISS